MFSPHWLFTNRIAQSLSGAAVLLQTLIGTIPLGMASDTTSPSGHGAIKVDISNNGSDSGWIELFNGKDLSGWQANASPESFAVEGGLLRLQAKRSLCHLFYVGDTSEDVIFKDFELEATIRAEPDSNSGIFFHTGRELRLGVFLVKGYEVQLNSSPKEQSKTGGLYDIVDLKESPVDETSWFKLRVRVEGNHIQVFVDDKQVVDYIEPAEPQRNSWRAQRLLDPNGGAIAIQAHDKRSVYYFKRFRIRRLN